MIDLELADVRVETTDGFKSADFPKPGKGDQVLVSYVAEYSHAGSFTGRHVFKCEDGSEANAPTDANVIVIKKAAMEEPPDGTIVWNTLTDEVWQRRDHRAQGDKLGRRWVRMTNGDNTRVPWGTIMETAPRPDSAYFVKLVSDPTQGIPNLREPLDIGVEHTLTGEARELHIKRAAWGRVDFGTARMDRYTAQEVAKRILAEVGLE